MEIDPIVVAYADADHPHEVMNVAMCEGNYGCEVPLMTVAQHERIVAGLEARLIRWAQGLIEQLPTEHEGRNSWLMNHGVGEESDWLRAEHKRYTAAWRGWHPDYPQPVRRRYHERDGHGRMGRES